MQVQEDYSRVVIEAVSPQIDCGQYPIKRRSGEQVVVEADVFADGHEAVSAALLYRHSKSTEWTEVPMTPLVNDRWTAEFGVVELGTYVYTVQGWLDHFKFWSQSLVKRLNAGQDVSVDLKIGANIVEGALAGAEGAAKTRLQEYLDALRAQDSGSIEAALSTELARLMYRYEPRKPLTTYSRELEVAVDRRRALFSSWYEFFPRSCSPEPGKHGTFRDAEERLAYAASMGFDVIYLPPVHPIGTTHRKGKNNNTVAQPGEFGSPWAIGSEEGGHKAIHPSLGTFDDFDHFTGRAKELGVEVALDIAFQCSPDHPYVKEHPNWFRKRPDGTIQYAENPPKKYEDIYPFDFEGEDWLAMWHELRSVIQFWIDRGIRLFRVDNPHTKSLKFWEWCISTIKADRPDIIFLAEAFTRPKVTYLLAKAGFSQSYTYFTWRNTSWELTEYLTQLTGSETVEYFGPNFWPNTPDILPEVLQIGGRPAFISRLVLAATLAASYGIYGPAYELGVNSVIAPGKEEYLDSEKYELKRWDVDDPTSLRPLITRVNEIRRENPALQHNRGLRFHATGNDRIIAYSKATGNLDNVVLVVVSLDFTYTQSGTVELPLEDLGIDPHQPYQVQDLLTGARYMWSGSRNYVELNPHVLPAHIFSLRRHVTTEQDFDYYL